MPGKSEASAQDFVLRALAASEIAESCTEPRIRESFFALAEGWLKEAGRAEDPGDAPSAPEGLRL
jgi:hypothetical protein